MNKKLISLLLSLIMIFSTMITAVPVQAVSLEPAITVSVKADKTEVYPGETVSYRVTVGPVNKMADCEFGVVIPDSLTYASATVSDTVSANFQGGWTESTKKFVIYGGNYTSNSDTLLLTVTCTAKESAVGTSARVYLYDPFFCDTSYEDYAMTDSEPGVSVNIVEKPISVTGVSLNKTTAELTTGSTLSLTATVSPSNATNKNVTWKSSNTSVATVNSSGVVTAVKAGSVTITVTTADGSKTASCTVTVKDPVVNVTGVSLNKTTAELTTGSTFSLTATVAPSNATNKNVTWKSSNTSVATVSSSGVVTAVKAGSATITVTTADGSKTASCTVTVKDPVVNVTGVSLNKTTAELTTGSTFSLTATVAPSNATNKNVTWKSSNTSVATVSSSGVVTAVKAGSATITVTTADGNKTASCTVTVVDKTPSPAISVSVKADKTEVYPGDTITYRVFVGPISKMADCEFGVVIPDSLTYVSATVSDVVSANFQGGWTESTKKFVIYGGNYTSTSETLLLTITCLVKDTAVASSARVYIQDPFFCDTTGNDYAMTDSEPSVSVNIISKPASVTGVSLNFSAKNLNVGNILYLTATVSPSNATNKSVSWKSSNTSVATVSSSGVVTAVGVGTATITVTTADGNKTATCTVTVSASSSSCTYSVVPNKTTVTRGEIIDFTIYIQQTGTLNVIEGTLSIPAGLTFVEGSGELTPGIKTYMNWDSLDWTPSAMMLNGYGVYSFTGTEKISLMTFKCRVNDDATFANYKVNLVDLAADNENYNTKNPICIPATISVEEKNVAVTGVSLNCPTVELIEWSAFELNAIVTPNNATNKSVTWKSSDTSVATVNSNGVVVAVKAGTATITVTTADGSKTDTCIVTVIPAYTCNVTPKMVTAVSGDTVRLTFSLSGASPLKSFAISMNYTDSVFEVVSGEWLIDGFISDFDKDTKSAVIGFVDETVCNTDVFTLNLKVKEEPPAGCYGVSFDVLTSSNEVCSTYADVFLSASCSHSNKSYTAGKASDCKNQGWDAYWKCNDCSQLLAADGTTKIDKVPMKGLSNNHTGGTTIINAKSADHKSQTPGYTGDTKCLGCNEIIKYGSTIAPGAHTQSSSWTVTETHHFKVCSVSGCGTVIESTKAKHSFTDKNVCSTCGIKRNVATSAQSGSGVMSIRLLDSEGKEIKATTASNGEYTLTAPNGTYTLEVSKKDHVTRTYKVDVNSGFVVQDVQLCLKGDINGDGKVNTADVGRANAHAKKTNLLDGYAFACADVNGDGKVNTADVGRMNAHAKKTNLLW